MSQNPPPFATSLPHQPQKVIVIAGPTACGKSEFALLLAQAVGGEIVSADSMQVYRGLDIGTAKVSAEDRIKVPHHLIDICEITDPFTVMEFYKRACQTIEEIHRRKAVAIVVGGTGFYLHTLLYGPPKGPPSLPQVRKELEEELKILGTEPLYERLRALDPDYAQTITCKDKHKIVRGLEIISSGQKVSTLPWRESSPEKKFNFTCWFFYRPREILHRRIEKRCQEMVEKGFLDEVERVKHLLCQNLAAAQAIGYRQALHYLSSLPSKQSREEFMQKFIIASRQYAKRQLTWFRREPLFQWLDIDLLKFEDVVDTMKNCSKSV